MMTLKDVLQACDRNAPVALYGKGEWNPTFVEKPRVFLNCAPEFLAVGVENISPAVSENMTGIADGIPYTAIDMSVSGTLAAYLVTKGKMW